MYVVGVGCFLQVSLCDHNIRNNNKKQSRTIEPSTHRNNSMEFFFFFRCIRVVLKNTDFVCFVHEHTALATACSKMV